MLAVNCFGGFAGGNCRRPGLAIQGLLCCSSCVGVLLAVDFLYAVAAAKPWLAVDFGGVPGARYLLWTPLRNKLGCCLALKLQFYCCRASVEGGFKVLKNLLLFRFLKTVFSVLKTFCSSKKVVSICGCRRGLR